MSVLLRHHRFDTSSCSAGESSYTRCRTRRTMRITHRIQILSRHQWKANQQQVQLEMILIRMKHVNEWIYCVLIPNCSNSYVYFFSALETESRTANLAQMSSSTTTVTASSTGLVNESNSLTANEQNNEQRRDIRPIVYDVQSIPTIGTGGSTQITRGVAGRQRPSISSEYTRRTYAQRSMVVFIVF
jgi:hypothetical protein